MDNPLIDAGLAKTTETGPAETNPAGANGAGPSGANSNGTNPNGAAPQTIKVSFTELDGGDQIEASFPSINGSKPFTIILKEMNWGLVEDMERIQQGGSQVKDILDFWRTYIVGGPKAVPLKHTFTAFEAIVGYMRESLPRKN